MILYDPNQIQIENTNSYLETVKKTALFFFHESSLESYCMVWT